MRSLKIEKMAIFLSICLYLSPIYAADRFTIAKEKIVNEFMECMSNKDMGNGVVSFCYGKAADTLEALGDMYVIDRQTQKIDEDEINIIKEDVLFFKRAILMLNIQAIVNIKLLNFLRYVDLIGPMNMRIIFLN